MPAVQTNYDENLGRALLGQVANPQTCDIDTAIAANDIPFGRAVRNASLGGVSDDYVRCQLGVTSILPSPFTINSFFGIAVKDPTRDASERGENGDGVDQYAENDAHVAVLWRGDVWVEVPAADSVSRGNRLNIVLNTGQFTVVAPRAGSSSILAIGRVGAATGGRAVKALSNKTSNNLVLVRLYGDEQII